MTRRLTAKRDVEISIEVGSIAFGAVGTELDWPILPPHSVLKKEAHAEEIPLAGRAKSMDTTE